MAVAHGAFAAAEGEEVVARLELGRVDLRVSGPGDEAPPEAFEAREAPDGQGQDAARREAGRQVAEEAAACLGPRDVVQEPEEDDGRAAPGLGQALDDEVVGNEAEPGVATAGFADQGRARVDTRVAEGVLLLEVLEQGVGEAAIAAAEIQDVRAGQAGQRVGDAVEAGPGALPGGAEGGRSAAIECAVDFVEGENRFPIQFRPRSLRA